ncbi:MAG: hypothetical protein K6F61_04165 [Clostridiales bacterium]|nr:hypothetical protein [Clostridiales bacterium]
MRKDSRKQNNITLSSIQGYHGGNWGESYAFEGFKSNKYFTSDRYIPLDYNWQRSDGKPLKGFGLEIETECWAITDNRVLANILTDVVFKPFPDDLFKLQHDSSLGCDGDYDDDNALGVECITQIMTKQFIRNHYKDFKSMYDTFFRNFGFSCDRSGNCGMHVNVSNALFGDTVAKQKDSIRKLHYFINRNYAFACRLLNRDEDHTGYCDQMYFGSKDECKDMSIYGGDHGSCMNYSHFDSGRVEIRLVGGQGNFQEFRNTMEVVFFLVDRMRKISWDDLDDMTKVFNKCNQYVAKRLRYCGLNFNDYETILQNVVTEDLELA